ncbi:MAG: S-layer homology domain-containing protein [Clostridiales bacterium]|nr:S-layer homology domain-containing protein [Clostridiales bacterium]
MKKTAMRTAGLFTAAVMLSQVCTFGASDNFKDVTSKYDWASEAIDSLYAEGIVTGFEDGYFRPAANIRRCDFVIMLYNKFGESGSYSAALPEDVEEGVYYENAYRWAAAADIVGSGELFYPTDDITRQDAFEMLFKCLKADGTIDDSEITSNLSAFYDSADVDADKMPAIGTLVSLGIVSGSDGMILPKNTMTRAEMAVVFYKAGIEEEEAEEEASGIIVDGSTSVNVASADSKYNITTSVDTNYLVDGIEASISDEKIEVADGGKSGIIIQNGASLTLDNSALVKSGDSTSSVNTGSSGVNSAIVLRNGSTLEMTKTTINNKGTYSNGINVQDGGNTLTIKNSEIVTNAENSTPLLVSDNSTVNISDSSFTNKSSDTPAINISGDEANAELVSCILKAHGSGAPALRSSAEKLVLKSGEYTSKTDAAIETIGNASVHVEGATLTGAAALFRITSTAKTASDYTTTCTATFKGTDLTSDNGEAVFEVINTNADIYVTDCTLESSDVLLNSRIDTTSNAYAKGADTVLTLDGQDAVGDILSNWAASATLVLKNGSVFTGALNPHQEGTVNVELISASDKLVLTKDCYVGYIENHGDSGFYNIVDNGHDIYYDTTDSRNIWLDEDTYVLPNGGQLKPY